MRLPPRTAAQIAIGVQFAALLRTLAEFFRLKHVFGAALTLAQVEPFVLGALVTSVCALVAVLLYFGEKFWLTVAVAAANVAILLALKFVLL